MIAGPNGHERRCIVNIVISLLSLVATELFRRVVRSELQRSRGRQPQALTAHGLLAVELL